MVQADIAVYDAKAAGRDRYRFHTQPDDREVEPRPAVVGRRPTRGKGLDPVPGPAAELAPAARELAHACVGGVARG